MWHAFTVRRGWKACQRAGGLVPSTRTLPFRGFAGDYLTIAIPVTSAASSSEPRLEAFVKPAETIIATPTVQVGLSCSTKEAMGGPWSRFSWVPAQGPEPVVRFRRV